VCAGDHQLDAAQALLPLPEEPYEYAEWKRCRVNLDCHVEIAQHYYSVPRGVDGHEIEARITARTVEIFLPRHERGPYVRIGRSAAMKLKLGLTSGPTVRRDGSRHRTDDARPSTDPKLRLDDPDRRDFRAQTGARAGAAPSSCRAPMSWPKCRFVRTSGGQTFS
jgi:hypothetical protein